MRHPINSSEPLVAQLRAVGLESHAPGQSTILYRFLDHAGQLLYVGITVNPAIRWQHHKNRAPWWANAAEVLVEWHDHEGYALMWEKRAIKSEGPTHNKRSAIPTPIPTPVPVASASRAPVPTTQGKGREGIGREGEGKAGSHSSSGRSRPSKAADRLTVASCPSMNELGR